MVEHFNVALSPCDNSTALFWVDLAQANCGDLASEYLLGEKALPHVTLCQFKLATSAVCKLPTVWEALLADDIGTGTLSLRFTHIYIKPEVDIAKYWVGLAVQSNEELLRVQKQVYEKLWELEIHGGNSPQSYFPHLTWARCREHLPFVARKMPEPEFWKGQYEFALTIGRSNENGVYQECLFP